MKLLLHFGVLDAVLCLAVSLNCYQYRGLPDQAQQKQVAIPCDSTHTHCSSTLIQLRHLLNGDVLAKGCSTGDACNHNQTYIQNNIQVSQNVMCCDSELCNQHLEPDLGEDASIECLACHGSPLACAGNNLPTLRCEPSQKHCIEVSVTMAVSQETQHTMIKSCSKYHGTCPELAAFSNGDNPVYYASGHLCCNSSHCNSGHFTEVDPGAENGLECYSRSSSKGVSKMQCRGRMTQCVDLIGSSPDDVVMSGCSTEAFCRGLYPPFHIPGWTSSVCCEGSLCNHGNKVIDPGVKKQPN